MNFSIFITLSYEETFFFCQNHFVLLLILGIFTVKKVQRSLVPRQLPGFGKRMNDRVNSVMYNVVHWK